MPIQHAIWKFGATPEALTVSKLATEKDLEDMITARPEMISSGWMLIGRQVRTSFGGIIDLLAIAPDGSLVCRTTDKSHQMHPFPEIVSNFRCRSRGGLPILPQPLIYRHAH
jgi:hypothetical protein